MRKLSYTAILQFEVIQTAHEGENIGDKITLDETGNYSHETLYRPYKLLYLLENDLYYRVSAVVMSGENMRVLSNRPKNYAKNLKYKKEWTNLK